MTRVDDAGSPDAYESNFDEFGDIKADMHAMQHYADRLSANIATNYQPLAHDAMQPLQTILPQPPGEFEELVSFMQVQNAAQNNMLKNVFNYHEGSLIFATAASEISKKYTGSDAFAHAKVSDVNKDLSLNLGDSDLSTHSGASGTDGSPN